MCCYRACNYRLFSGDPEGRNPLLKQRNLPESFFEPESENESEDMPEDLKLMVNHVRLLRYLGRDVVQGLSSVISTIELRSGRFLFRDGDPEDKIFVVKSGRLDLRVIDEDGSTTTIHELTTGGNPYSLLAIIDAMNNLQPKYQNIEAVAVSRCSVVCLSISDLIKVCRDFPPANLRLAQMIIIRLHRVTFAALHNFFGLDKELFSQEPQTFLKESAVKSVLGRFGKSGRNAASNVPLPVHDLSWYFLFKPSRKGAPSYPKWLFFVWVASSHKKRKSKPAILMPAGSSTADHLIPPQATTSTGSLDEMGSLVPSNSVSKLLELGEVADGVSECSGRLSRTPSMRSTKLHDALVRAAQQDLARLFGISEGGQVLDKMVSVIDVNAGDVVIKETEIQPELYYIISGGFVLTQLNSVPGSVRFRLFHICGDLGVRGRRVARGNFPDILNRHVKSQCLCPLKAFCKLRKLTKKQFRKLRKRETTQINHSPSLVAHQTSTKTVAVFEATPGELIGLLGVITGEPNNCSVQASADSRVAVLPRNDFFSLVRAYPQVLTNAAHLVSLRLSPLLRQADFAIEWHGVDAGKALFNPSRLRDCTLFPILLPVEAVAMRIRPLAVKMAMLFTVDICFRQGDCSNYVYVVLNGRFREVHTNDDGSRTVIAESGRGAFLGYVEVTSCKPRVNTVLAIRDSEVVKMPSILLNWLKQLTPNPINRFIQLLSDRLMQPSSYSICSDGFNQPAVDLANSEPLNSTRCVLQKSQLNAAGSGGVMANLRAIAILATTPEINTEAFTLEMQHAMSVFGSSIRLTSGMQTRNCRGSCRLGRPPVVCARSASGTPAGKMGKLCVWSRVDRVVGENFIFKCSRDIIKKRIGENAFEPLNDYRLCSWLSHQEDLHRMVFYIADSHRSSAWTRRCLRQADCVVVLALGSTEDPSKLSPVEQVIDSCTTKVTKILVLMYPLETEYPPAKKTASWLNARPWVTQHYHIRCPPRVLNPTVKNLITFYSQVFLVEEPNPHSDMSRLVRYLTGQAVGLVLGGGGAKGGAHVGIIRVLQEAGIPIDMVGGTSIGALIGAMWAEETRVAEFSQRSRDFALVFKSIWPKIRDLTYPTVSLFSGYEFNAYIEATFKDRQIEDLWLPYFCVTTDISNCKMRVHTSGSLWRYVRSSMTYPLLLPPLCDPRDGHLLVDGVFVNVVPVSLFRLLSVSILPSVHPTPPHDPRTGSLWRYVRSSMSLSGYMPPLCDPVDGSYLLDGGYTNNVPADIMASFGAKTIYAVDVGSVYDTNLTNYGDWLSGWWLIYQRFFRWWGPPIRVPNFTEIQSRLAYISCIRQLEEVKSSGICHYLRPPIDRFMTLQFSAFEEIVAVGYNYGKEMLEEWQRSGAFNQMMPNTYKRVRYRSSGGHRKARSVSIGALSTSTSSVLADDATHQDPTAADSHVAETAVKRRRGSLEKMSPPPSTEADEGRHRPDFNDEWWKTWLRLHPERISKLALGSTAFDRMDDGKMLPLAEQWLYAPSKLHKSRKSTRRSKPRSRAPVLAKSVTPDSKRLVPTKGSPSDNEGDFSMDDEEGVEAVDAADDFLVTASDPELSSIRYTMATTKLSHHHRSADKGASLTEVGLSDGEITPKVAVVKAPHRRHRLRRRGSLNKVSCVGGSLVNRQTSHGADQLPVLLPVATPPPTHNQFPSLGEHLHAKTVKQENGGSVASSAAHSVQHPPPSPTQSTVSSSTCTEEIPRCLTAPPSRRPCRSFFSIVL
ncbi:unnamed protein product [Mesocestoides corti]|uniref:Swiss cheese n=1 Tax=Mesocestoides corti TaxID=53468 RepID=A0A3P6HMI6_MESCO|nr:unnamed protein product [Mesocestoides corti]